jgi:hypothetical protein
VTAQITVEHLILATLAAVPLAGCQPGAALLATVTQLDMPDMAL